MTDKLSEVFDLQPMSVAALPAVIVDENTVATDAQEVRGNLKRLSKVAEKALEHASDMATQSDSPRAYEVLATLLATAADLQTRVMDVHQREQKLTAPAAGDTPPPTNVTNNSIVFTGTTSELKDIIKQRLEKI